MTYNKFFKWYEFVWPSNLYQTNKKKLIIENMMENKSLQGPLVDELE